MTEPSKPGIISEPAIRTRSPPPIFLPVRKNLKYRNFFSLSRSQWWSEFLLCHKFIWRRRKNIQWLGTEESWRNVWDTLEVVRKTERARERGRQEQWAILKERKKEAEKELTVKDWERLSKWDRETDWEREWGKEKWWLRSKSIFHGSKKCESVQKKLKKTEKEAKFTFFPCKKMEFEWN